MLPRETHTPDGTVGLRKPPGSGGWAIATVFQSSVGQLRKKLDLWTKGLDSYRRLTIQEIKVKIVKVSPLFSIMEVFPNWCVRRPKMSEDID